MQSESDDLGPARGVILGVAVCFGALLAVGGLLWILSQVPQ